MDRGVAKALCQQFIWAKLMYSATDPFNRSYRDKSLWKVTPKGLILLNEFCERIEIHHPLLLLFTMENATLSIDQFKILHLDRNEDDQLILSRPNMTSLFRTMINAISSSDEYDYHGLLYKHTNMNNNTIVHKVKKHKKKNHDQQQRRISLSSESSSSIYSNNGSQYYKYHHHHHNGNHSNRSSMVSSIHSSNSPLSTLSISSSPSSASSKPSPTYDMNNSNNNNNNINNNHGSGGNYFSTILEKFNLYDSKKSNTPSSLTIYKHHHYNHKDNFDDEESEDDDGPQFDDNVDEEEEEEEEEEENDSEEEYATIRRMRVIFTSQYCCDWLGASCSLVSRDEAEMLSTQFLKHGWVRFYKEEDNNEFDFIESSKHILLSVTPKGRQLVIDGIHTTTTTTTSQCQTPINITPTTPTTPVFNFNSSTTSSSSYLNTHLDDISSYPTSSPLPLSSTTYSDDYPYPILEQKSHFEKDNHQQQHSSKLMMILKDAQLRSLFKDFLNANFCVENLDFWIDYHHLKNKYKNKYSTLSNKHQKELLDDAIIIWAKYLSPKAKHELNIDHDLQQDLKRYVKSIVQFEKSSASSLASTSSKITYISTQTVSQSLRTLLKRFDLVEIQICRLMASDSVPKFTNWLHQTFKKNNKNEDNTNTNTNNNNNSPFLKLNLQSLKIKI
ncbi:unnamed protein product [Cunninghamella blakesleeana]